MLTGVTSILLDPASIKASGHPGLPKLPPAAQEISPALFTHSGRSAKKSAQKRRGKILS